MPVSVLGDDDSDSSLIDSIKAQFIADGHGDRLGKAERPKLDDVASAVSETVKKVWDRGYDGYVYEPLGLTRELVLARPDSLAPLPEAIVSKAMDIAAEICVYTNRNITVEKL